MRYKRTEPAEISPNESKWTIGIASKASRICWSNTSGCHLTGAFCAGNFRDWSQSSLVIIPATPSNPSIPYVKRTSKSLVYQRVKPPFSYGFPMIFPYNHQTQQRTHLWYTVLCFSGIPRSPIWSPAISCNGSVCQTHFNFFPFGTSG